MLPPQSFIEQCQKVGKVVPFWTQGAGGNISVKEENFLWIKASGSRLDQVSLSSGIAAIDFNKFNAFLETLVNLSDSEQEEAYAAQLKNDQVAPWGRPSMETVFHALLPKKWVFHFHSLASLLMSHQARNNSFGWREWVKKNAKFEIKEIPMLRPGLVLGQSLAACSNFEVFLLQNHGVVLQSDKPFVIEDWEDFENSFLDDWGYFELLELKRQKDLRLLDKQEGRLKLYFPDTAVFALSLKKCLEKAAAAFVWNSNDDEKCKDLKEIWHATLLLQRAEPNLAEISDSLASQIANLPTEAFRKSIRE